LQCDARDRVHDGIDRTVDIVKSYDNRRAAAAQCTSAISSPTQRTRAKYYLHNSETTADVSAPRDL